MIDQGKVIDKTTGEHEFTTIWVSKKVAQRLRTVVVPVLQKKFQINPRAISNDRILAELLDVYNDQLNGTKK